MRNTSPQTQPALPRNNISPIKDPFMELYIEHNRELGHPAIKQRKNHVGNLHLGGNNPIKIRWFISNQRDQQITPGTHLQISVPQGGKAHQDEPDSIQ